MYTNLSIRAVEDVLKYYNNGKYNNFVNINVLSKIIEYSKYDNSILNLDQFILAFSNTSSMPWFFDIPNDDLSILIDMMFKYYYKLKYARQ